MTDAIYDMKEILKKTFRFEVLFFVALALVLLVRLGESSLWEPDEPRYAEAVREMFETGDYFTPHYNYEYRFDKPILYYWFIASTAKVIGLNEISLRFPSALFTFLTVLFMYLLVRRIYSRGAAICSIVVLSTLFNFLKLGRYGIPDATWIFFITAGMYYFLVGLTDKDRSKHYIPLGYVMLSLASLVKSPVGAMIPALTFAVYMFLRRDWNLWKRMKVNLGILIYFGLTLPWYIFMIVKYKSDYFDYYFMSDHVLRFFSDDFLRARPIYYYGQILIGDLMPWTLFLILAVIIIMPDWKTVLSRKNENITLLIFLWALIVFALFSLSGTKLPHYISPIFPPFAIIAGVYMSRFLDRDKKIGKRCIISQITIVVSLLIIGLALFVHVNYLISEGMTQALTYIVPILSVLLAGATLHLVIKRDFRKFIYLTGIGLLVMYTSVILLLLPVYDKTKPVKEISYHLKEIVKEGDIVCLYKTINPAIMYYLEQKVVEINTPEDLQNILARNRRVFVVTKGLNIIDFENKITQPIYEIKRMERYLPRFSNFYKSPKKAISFQLVLLTNIRSEKSGK